MAVAAAALLSASRGTSAGETGRLPEGDAGIAAKYPLDRGIDRDPSVIFADDFEAASSARDIRRKWDALVHEDNISIVEDAAAPNGGRKSMLIAIPRQDEPLAVEAARTLRETQDVLFLRWYMKFDAGWLVPGGSVHNGASVSSKYNERGRATPGIRADGRNKFLVNCECENSTGKAPGLLNVYVYWPEQADRWGDHFYPSGTVIPFSSTRSGAATFGKGFAPRPDLSPEPGRWHCYEYMVKANAPGRRDGRIAIWVDGRLAADFPNLRLRDVEDLRIDRFGLGLYIASNTARTNLKWHDDVVAATSYIGPVAVPAPAPAPRPLARPAPAPPRDEAADAEAEAARRVGWARVYLKNGRTDLARSLLEHVVERYPGTKAAAEAAAALEELNRPADP
jgi:hypothetical protein